MKRYIDAEKLEAEIERQMKHLSASQLDERGAIIAYGVVLGIVTVLQQEQPEPTCKTCGFYENNCPFIRGKFIPYPSKACKDYTYSAMKEQSYFADADKMEQPGVDEPEYGPYARQYPKSEVSQEQPEADLEKEIDNYVADNFSEAHDGVLLSDASKTELSIADIAPMARHFAEWGATHLNTRKEE